VGSVDDGKSTLLGRLMLDSKALMADHLSHVEEASRRRGFGRVELALLTDGLRAEREQGITIDVAWRYFATPRRSFVLADAPGHEQYTRNMLTGASTSDAILLLVDARRGPTAQTRRHVALTSLLGVPSVLVCINKMDEVGFAEQRFRDLSAEVDAMFAPFGPRNVTYAPIAALDGDNVVAQSRRTPYYYDGPTVLDWLESAPAPRERSGAFVLPIQWVVRPQTEAHRDYRGFAGRLERGIVRVGDEVTVLPSGESARVKTIEHGGRAVESAVAASSVVLLLDREIDASRGDVVVAAESESLRTSNEHVADVFWLAQTPARVGGRYLVKQLTTRCLAKLTSVTDSLDVASLARSPADTLRLNDVGRAELRTARPLVWEPYDAHRGLGSLVLIDESTGDTVAAGLLRAA
jgi:sulfate adenylyltransferase large subunit